MATCFVALFPFVRHSFAEATEAASIHEHYPFAEFSLLAGFFMIVFIEIIVTAREGMPDSIILLARPRLLTLWFLVTAVDAFTHT